MPNTDKVVPEPRLLGVQPAIYTKTEEPSVIRFPFTEARVYHCFDYKERYWYWTWRFGTMHGKRFDTREEAKCNAASQIKSELEKALSIMEKAVVTEKG